MNYRRFILTMCITCIISPARGDEESWSSNTRFTGFTSFEFGQVRKTLYQTGLKEHWWMERVRARLLCESSVNSWSTLLLGMECEYNPTFRHSNVGSYASEFYLRYLLHQAEGIITFLNGSRAKLDLGIGYFPYKYNENARNLGEFFFRMRPYPGYMDTQFDFPLERLLGARLHAELGGGSNLIRASNDLLLLSATQAPVYDFSLAYLGKISLAQIGRIGFGVNLNRLLPTDENATTPPGDRYVDSAGNTYYYSSKSTNLLGYLSIDPKALFPHGIFGREDLKIYGEAAIMGTKSYPFRYDSLWQRLPVMAGFNIPAFKMLDVFACEVEWWGNPWPNNLQQMYSSNAFPVPQGFGMGLDTLRAYTQSDNWKWSVYAKRSVRNIEIIGQIARDHLHGFYVDMSEKEWGEVCSRPDHWYYMVKFLYRF